MSRPSQTTGQAAARRLAQLGRVCRLQRREGLCPSSTVWGPITAQTLSSAHRRYRLTDAVKLTVALDWQGLTGNSLRDAMKRMGFDPSPEEIAEWISRTPKHGLPVERTLLGRLINLTAAQRKRSRAWSIEAVDEPANKRQARTREEAKAANTKGRRNRRHDKGVLPREVYREIVATPRVWDFLGLSRSHWYRLGKPLSIDDMRRGLSLEMSTAMRQGPSRLLSTDETGSVPVPIKNLPAALLHNGFNAAPAASIRPSKPSLGITAGAGFGVAGDTPVSAPFDQTEPCHQKWLFEGCLPLSASPIRPRRSRVKPSSVESPRARQGDLFAGLSSPTTP
jgi:hypothetical protein